MTLLSPKRLMATFHHQIPALGQQLVGMGDMGVSDPQITMGPANQMLALFDQFMRMF